MLQILRPVTRVLIRRTIYSLMLCVGFLGLTGMMMRDAQALLAGDGVAAVAAPQTGLKPLTKGEGMDGFGTWSPDGKRIAFMRDGHILLMNANGGTPVTITNNESTWDAMPAWSPDGTRIAFARLTMHGESAALMLVEPKTKKAWEVASEREPIGHIAWSPSGGSLYYTTPTRLMRLDIASKQSRQILTVASDWEMMAGGLAISPDGKMAVFGAGPREGRGVSYNLWIAPLDGSSSDLTQLTKGGGIMPAFDRAGKRLLYRNPRHETGIYLMDLAKHATQRIVADEKGAMYFHPCFSPDGRSVLLSRLLLATPAPGSGGEGRFTSHLYLHTLSGSGGD